LSLAKSQPLSSHAFTNTTQAASSLLSLISIEINLRRLSCLPFAIVMSPPQSLRAAGNEELSPV
jgi:hypothetical protein